MPFRCLPARMLGVEGQLGSLVPGKVADVVVTSGDPLEIQSRVEYVFIGGRQVDLSNHQTRLRDRYTERIQRLLSPTPDRR